MIAARFIHHAQTRWEDWFGRFSPQFLPLATPRTARLIVVTLLRVHDLKIGGAVLYYESLCRRKRVAQLYVTTTAGCSRIRSGARWPCQRFWPGTHKISALPL